MLYSWAQGMLMQEKIDSSEIRNQRAPASTSWIWRKRLDTLTMPSYISELESHDMRLFDNAKHQLGCTRLYDMREGGGPVVLVVCWMWVLVCLATQRRTVEGRTVGVQGCIFIHHHSGHCLQHAIPPFSCGMGCWSSAPDWMQWHSDSCADFYMYKSKSKSKSKSTYKYKYIYANVSLNQSCRHQAVALCIYSRPDGRKY